MQKSLISVRLNFQDSKHFVPVADKNRIQIDEGLSPIVYVQSSCDAPSERDAYILELQKYIDIDSYGKCLNNKQLPEQLSHLKNFLLKRGLILRSF